MAASSDHSARARIWVAFLLLFVVLAAVSVGVYYLGKLQETMAALEGRIALDAINAGQIDAALARHPSNKFLKLIATATKAGIETRAATEKLSQEIEPPALAKDINQATASRNDLEALRRDLKTAEANATSFLPRYLALVKAERDRLEAYARSLNLEKDVLSQIHGSHRHSPGGHRGCYVRFNRRRAPSIIALTTNVPPFWSPTSASTR